MKSKVSGLFAVLAAVVVLALSACDTLLSEENITLTIRNTSSETISKIEVWECSDELVEANKNLLRATAELAWEGLLKDDVLKYLGREDELQENDPKKLEKCKAFFEATREYAKAFNTITHSKPYILCTDQIARNESRSWPLVTQKEFVMRVNENQNQSYQFRSLRGDIKLQFDGTTISGS